MKIQEGFVICDVGLKEKIIRSQTGFKNYIFLTEEELLEKITFKIKRKAIYLLMQKYGFSYSLALDYLKAIRLINNDTYNTPKLDSIVSAYRYLIEKKMLVEDDLFLIRLTQFPVTFIDSIPSKEHFALVNKVKQYTEVIELNFSDEKNEHIAYEFSTILNESLFIFNLFRELITAGVEPKNIYIFNANEDYLYLFRRLARNYKLPINLPPFKNILSTKIIQTFLKQCETAENFNEALAGLSRENPLYDIIIEVLNKAELIDELPNKCLAFLKEEFICTPYLQKKYSNGINVLTNPIVLEPTDYAFFVGFNLGSAPIIKQEDGFLNDKDLKMLKASTSYEQNNYAYQKLTAFLNQTKNVVITYKRLVNTENYLPSLLVEKLGMEVKKPDVRMGYAKIEDDLRLASFYDDYLKFGSIDSNLEKYGIEGIRYNQYKHQYQAIDEKMLDEHFKNKTLKLAYSNVKLFFACPFSYYADRILNLNDFEPSMAARLGTYSHAVLEDSYDPDFNFGASIIKHKMENCEDAKDEFFFTQMESVLANLIAFNKIHEGVSTLKEIKREEHIVVTKEGYTFEGFIDKLMYTIIDDTVYAAIVDYKTGKDVVSLDNIEDGFHLQLPSYMYLLSNYEPFKDYNLKIIGIYLQKVNIVIFDDKSKIDEQMSKNFKLEGYTVADEDLIRMLDPTYLNSTYIKSLGMTSNGFRSYSKIFEPNKQEEIIHMVDRLINRASRDIKSGEFKIAPKMINDKNESCAFCKYRDLCFVEYEDLVELAYKPFGKERN